uniref:TGF-beta family profile domain-containing protein n=1 Tax=Eptatretus burgeri TaxID=7764 RepID=A0A8C4RAY5_EPTBU
MFFSHHAHLLSSCTPWPLCLPCYCCSCCLLELWDCQQTDGSLSPGEVVEGLINFPQRLHKLLRADTGHYKDEDLNRSGRRGRRRKGRGNRKQKRPKKKPREHDCHLRLALVMARELGLGYDSDEVISFHFCAGDCAAARRTYHKAMESLARPGHAAEIAGLEASRPCCRPTNLTGVSFMDAQHTWRTAERVSASGCHCVI